jgi:hypothetical protein
VSARTVVRVVTENRTGGNLTMADLRIFVTVWGEATRAMIDPKDHDAADAVQPVVLTDGQGGGIRKIQADLPQPPP